MKKCNVDSLLLYVDMMLQRKSVFTWLAAVAVDLGKEQLPSYLPVMMAPLVREFTDASSKDGKDDRVLASSKHQLYLQLNYCIYILVGLPDLARVSKVNVVSRNQLCVKQKTPTAMSIELGSQKPAPNIIPVDYESQLLCAFTIEPSILGK